MKQLEDRIKDRLEGYESRLPEGDLAEFKALLEASAPAGHKRSPAYLSWLAPVAVAAGLALFFILRQDPQSDMIQVVDGSSLVADVLETSPVEAIDLTVEEPADEVATVHDNPSGARMVKQPAPVRVVDADPKSEDTASDVSDKNESEQVRNDRQTSVTEHKKDETPKDESPSLDSSAGHSPFVPAVSRTTKPVSVKVGQATAGVLGGTGALALASVLPSILKTDGEIIGPVPDDPVISGDHNSDPEPPVDSRTGNDTHNMPLRAVLSLRIPFSDRWSLTTGVDYSWYASELEYSLSGIHKQSAHYLGIPVRADFTIARNRWMDVYVGTGGSVDFCVAAYDTGQKIARDNVGFSLIGAGGIQFNINKNLGLFLDPTFSWNIPSDNRVLDTYRTENPFMLAVSTGLRFTIQTKH